MKPAPSTTIFEIIGAQMIIASWIWVACSQTARSASTNPTRQPMSANVFENVPMTTTFRRHSGTDAALQWSWSKTKCM